MEGNTVKPVFLKASDLASQISEYEVCTAVAKQIGHDNVLGGQKIRGLWRIYLTDAEARKLLITNQLTLQGHKVHVYDKKPFRAGMFCPDDEVTKVTIKDLPISYGMDEVKRYMEAQSIKVRRIDYGKARNPVTRELSKFYNGDRILYTDKIETPLPRTVDIAGQKVRIYHDGQEEKRRDMMCTKCMGKDHTWSRCRKPDDWCRLCHAQRHKAGDEACTSTTPEPQDHLCTVYGYKDPLSNHFPCTVKAFGQCFSSAEHAYKHTQAINAGKPDIAEKILAAPNANQAKEIAKNIPYNPQWKERKDEIMRLTLAAKMDQVQEFRESLSSSNNKVLVGTAAGDYYWGSGLATKHTQHTKVDKWPGENKLGEILSSLRTRLQEETSQGNSKSKKVKDAEQVQNRATRSQSLSAQSTSSTDP